MKNKIVREVIDFVKGNQSLFDRVLRRDFSEADELTMEQINLVVGILSKVKLAFYVSMDLTGEKGKKYASNKLGA